MKTLGPMIAERKAIIEHNARADNKEDELALPVRRNCATNIPSDHS